MITNHDRWRLYMEGFASPDNFIDWGFYYLIAAALQRRVWVGPDHSKLYPNIYVILVAEPGIGKGLVIKQVETILKYHKLPEPGTSIKFKDNAISPTDKTEMDIIAKVDFDNAQHSETVGIKTKLTIEKPLLLPVAANASTYEKLINTLSQSLRRINYKYFNDKLGREAMGIYTHSSLCFCLEEISSLFRKHTDDLVHLLIQAYDCGDYKYETKTQGTDRIRACCLNLFGGTTPGFMQTTFDDKLLTEGFSSRTFFIFSPCNRKTVLWIPDLTQSQKEAHGDIISHVEKLAYLYGRVEIEESTKGFIEEWWKEAQLKRPNTSIKLNPYYSRKNIHLLKLAMILHFADSTEMKMGIEPFKRALEILDKEERTMHYALGTDNNNPLAGPARKILGHIERFGKMTRKEIIQEFWESANVPQIDEIIELLQATGKLKTVPVENKLTNTQTIYYDVIRKE